MNDTVESLSDMHVRDAFKHHFDRKKKVDNTIFSHPFFIFKGTEGKTVLL